MTGKWARITINLELETTSLGSGLGSLASQSKLLPFPRMYKPKDEIKCWDELRNRSPYNVASHFIQCSAWDQGRMQKSGHVRDKGYNWKRSWRMKDSTTANAQDHCNGSCLIKPKSGVSAGI